MLGFFIWRGSKLVEPEEEGMLVESFSTVGFLGAWYSLYLVAMKIGFEPLMKAWEPLGAWAFYWSTIFICWDGKGSFRKTGFVWCLSKDDLLRHVEDNP